jgi:hypothetical protein
MRAGSYWYSTPAWTVQVNLNESGKVVWAGPLLKQFVGQHCSHIRAWCERKKWPLTVIAL